MSAGSKIEWTDAAEYFGRELLELGEALAEIRLPGARDRQRAEAFGIKLTDDRRLSA